MGFINIIKPTKFKVIFCAIVFMIAVLSYPLGGFSGQGSIGPGDNFWSILFTVLFFPAIAFTSLFANFKRCVGYTCSADNSLTLKISIVIFVIYVYIIACIIEIIVDKLRKKSNKSL